MKRPDRGCGTCKDRRILCDRAVPVCLHCVQSNRQCQGYGMRLSWPRPNDRRRAILGTTPSVKANGDHVFPFQFVNTASWDIETHYYLTGSRFNAPTRPTIPAPMSWNPIKSSTDNDLLQYFESVASDSILTVNEGYPTLREILIRIALSESAPSSAAVLQALLAFSSLHRHGLQSHAARLKLAALSALSASAKGGVGVDEVVPHIAAGMLLCCFEIRQTSETSSEWLQYICAVKNVLKAASPGSVEQNNEMTALLYWVSYHDVLAQFSLRHWQNRGLASGAMNEDLNNQVSQISSSYEVLEVSDAPFPCSGLLRLVSEAFNLVLESPQARSPTIDFKNLLTILEWKIRNLPCSDDPKDPSPGKMYPKGSKTLELFQLALLVYLERMSGEIPGQSDKISTRIENAFGIFSQLETFPRQFPLLILGCEARTDKDRSMILGLISRTEQNMGAHILRGMADLMHSLWAQDDLAEREICYTDKINAVLGSSVILPNFA